MTEKFDPKTSGKHDSYQVLPDFLKGVEPEGSTDNSVRMDRARFKWMSETIGKAAEVKPESLSDIGANMGYFSFMMANHFDAKARCYEPFLKHAEGIRGILSRSGWDAGRVQVHDRGVGLDDVDSLEESDLLIFLNVLHHAGEDFDQKHVPTIADWNSYAVDYLTRLRSRFKSMIFQLGYAWKGHGERFCGDREIPKFTLKLLLDAGWTVKACGVVESHNEITYHDIGQDAFDTFEVASMPGKGSLMERVLRKLGMGSPNVDGRLARFAQRPLYYCEKE